MADLLGAPQGQQPGLHRMGEQPALRQLLQEVVHVTWRVAAREAAGSCWRDDKDVKHGRAGSNLDNQHVYVGSSSEFFPRN